MARLHHRVLRLLSAIGIDPMKAFRLARGLVWYCEDFRELKKQGRSSKERFLVGTLFPVLNERHSQGGSARGHYFHQDLLVARRIYEISPECHFDVGSRVDGFVAHVATFMPIRVLDIRPIASSVRNIEFVKADLMDESDVAALGNACDSLSCLHALEHFGLGRYGDPIRWDGHLHGLRGLHSILKRGGRLYLSVPIGEQRIEFNAHRVFSVRYLLEHFEGRFHVDRFSYVDDNGDLHEDVDLQQRDVESNYGCHYGCGIFELTKL